MIDLILITILFVVFIIIILGLIKYERSSKEFLKRKRIKKNYSNIENCDEFNSKYETIMNEYKEEIKKQTKEWNIRAIICLIMLISFFVIPIALIEIFSVNIVLATAIMMTLLIVTLFLASKNIKIKNKTVGDLLALVNNNIKYTDLNEKYTAQEIAINNVYTNSGFRDKLVLPLATSTNVKSASDYIEYLMNDNVLVRMLDMRIIRYYISKLYIRLRHPHEEIFRGLMVKIENSITMRNNILIEATERYQKSLETFENVFDVYCTDINNATVVINESVKQELFGLYQEYGIMFEISIKNNNLYVRFYTGNMFEIDGKSLNGIKKKLCRDYYMFKDILTMINKINSILNQENIIYIIPKY